jgi:hypothetical protein
MLGTLVIGRGEPYGEREISEALGVPSIGSLPRDPKAAAVLSDGAPAGRLFTQSPLLRAARTVATRLVELAATHHSRLTPPSAPVAAPTTTFGASRVR